MGCGSRRNFARAVCRGGSWINERGDSGWLETHGVGDDLVEVCRIDPSGSLARLSEQLVLGIDDRDRLLSLEYEDVWLQTPNLVLAIGAA